MTEQDRLRSDRPAAHRSLLIFTLLAIVIATALMALVLCVMAAVAVWWHVVRTALATVLIAATVVLVIRIARRPSSEE